MTLPEDVDGSRGEIGVNPYLFHHSLSIHLSKDITQESGTQKSARYNRTQWLTLVTIAFGNFVIGAVVSLQAPFFPKEAEKKGATPSEYGLIFGMYQLTIFISAPIMGKVISFIEPKFLLNSGIFTVGVTCICFGLLDLIHQRTPFVALAFVIRILEGIGAASLRTSSYAIIAATFSSNMATTFAILETFLGLGLITGPTLGGALYDAGGYGLPFYVMGGLVLIDALVIFFVLPNPKRGNFEGKRDLLKFWLHPGILINALAVFTSFNYIGYNSATLEPHVRQFKLTGVNLGLLFALSGTLYAVTAPIWGWLADKKCDSKVMCIVGCCIMLLSLLLIGPMPFLNLENRLGITIAALALMGVSVGLKMVPTFSGSMKETIARGFPPDLTTYGLISSMVASSQSLGAFVGPSLGGYLMEVVGYDAGTGLLLALETLLIVILVIYTCVKKRSPNDEKKPLCQN